MGLTVIDNDPFATHVGQAALTRHSPASDADLAYADQRGEYFRIVRGVNDLNITAIVLKNTNGDDCFIYPNAAGNGIIVTTVAP